MRSLLFLALVASGCRIELGTPEAQKDCKPLTVDVCMNQAPIHDGFHWIADNILYKNCTGSACHQKGSTSMKAGAQIFDDESTTDLDARAKTAYTTLVNSALDGTGMPVTSDVVTGLPLVQPGAPDQSYLFFLMKGVDKAAFTPSVGDPPEDVGYMPRGNMTLCCQKLDLIQRWIEAGANFD